MYSLYIYEYFILLLYILIITHTYIYIYNHLDYFRTCNCGARPSSRTPTWRKTCSRTPSTAPPKPWRSAVALGKRKGLGSAAISGESLGKSGIAQWISLDCLWEIAGFLQIYQGKISENGGLSWFHRGSLANEPSQTGLDWTPWKTWRDLPTTYGLKLAEVIKIRVHG